MQDGVLFTRYLEVGSILYRNRFRFPGQPARTTLDLHSIAGRLR